MNLTSWLQRGVSSVFSLVGNLAVIVFLVFFILISGHQVRNRIVEISGPDADRRKTARKILDDIDAQLQRFLLVRVAAASRQGGR
jgi:predicted PurR-regulated permease PerM